MQEATIKIDGQSIITPQLVDSYLAEIQTEVMRTLVI